MKSIFKTITGIAAIAFFIASCSPDKKSDPVSNPAPTDPKQKWVASWNATETSKLNNPPTSSFVMHINDSAGSNYVIIENLYNVGFQYKVKGLVSGSNMTISPQQLTSGFQVSGSGVMVNNNTINMNYVVTNGTPDTCTAVLTK